MIAFRILIKLLRQEKVYGAKKLIAYSFWQLGLHVRGGAYEGGQKVLSPNILDYNFFTIYISVKRAFFTDSYESVADMASS